MKSQIPLPIAPPNRLDFGLYIATGANVEVVQALERLAVGGAGANIFLWGEAGTGKSHLLEAACNRAASRGLRCALVPLVRSDELSPEMLEGLEALDLVCVDDVDRIGGNVDWERALFNLFNRMREARRPLVLSSRQGPKALPLELSDLASRFAWDLVYRLAPLEEASRPTALQRRADVRGIRIPDEVVTYLVRRVPRDMHTLLGWLDRLDDESLAAQKKITVPFVRELLAAKS